MKFRTLITFGALVLAAAGDDDRLRAVLTGDLHAEQRDAARPVHQHRLAGPQPAELHQREPRRQPGDRQRARLGGRQRLRRRHGPLLVEDDVARQRTGAREAQRHDVRRRRAVQPAGFVA